MREVQAHEGISGLQAGHSDRHVSLCAGVGLNVGIFGVIDLAKPVYSDLLYLVDDLAASVIALAGIAFGVLVGADGTHRLEDMVADIIFRCNQFEAG